MRIGSFHFTSQWIDRTRWVRILLLVCLTALLGEIVSAAQDQTFSAQQHARKGVKLAQAGDLVAAEEQLRRAVELEPENALYLAQLAKALAMQNRIQEAGQYFGQAAQIDPDNLAIRRQLALTQWHQGELEEAERNLEMIAKAAPEDALPRLLLGMVAGSRGHHRRAIDLLESSDDLLWQRSDAIVALTQSYYAVGEQEKGRATAKRLLGASLESPQHGFLAARAARRSGDYETARQLLLRIRPDYPDPAALDHELALIHHQTGNFEACTRLLEDRIAAGSPPAVLYNLLGHCRQGQGDIKEAIESFQRAISGQPSAEDFYLDLLRLLAGRHVWRVALRVAEKGVEMIPTSHRLYEVKGLTESMSFDAEGSVRSFRRALELNPDSERAHRGLAVGLGAAGRQEEATALFEEGIQKFPGDVLNYQEYGLLLLKAVESGDEDALPRAVELLMKALELQEDLFEPHYQLGQLALADGHLKQALGHLETAVRIFPQEAKAHYALARAYRRAGRKEEAIRHFREHARLEKAQQDPHRDLREDSTP